MWKFIFNKILGWKLIGENWIFDKSVCCVAPHTSFLDGFIGFFAMKSLGVNYKVMAAKWLFFFPWKYVMKYFLHASPNKIKNKNVALAAVKILNSYNKCNLIICPEGTISPIKKWPKGFWTIAKKAKVPINIITLNYKTKTIYCTGFNIENMEYSEMIDIMYNTYKNFGYAKYPQKFELPK